MNPSVPNPSLSAPRKAYAETQRWFKEMIAAEELDDLALAWELFLIYHQRTWNKAEKLYEGTSYWPKLAKKYVPRRSNEPAVLYVHQARHVDEHGIAPVSAIRAASTTISAGTLLPGSKIVGGSEPYLAPGSTATFKINPATVVAHPVTNRGKEYLPPVFPDQPPGGTPVLEIARVALTFYDELFADLDAVGAP